MNNEYENEMLPLCLPFQTASNMNADQLLFTLAAVALELWRSRGCGRALTSPLDWDLYHIGHKMVHIPHVVSHSPRNVKYLLYRWLIAMHLVVVISTIIITII